MNVKIHVAAIFIFVMAVSSIFSIQAGCSNVKESFVEHLVKFVTKPEIFAVTPKTVQAYFKDFASIASREKDDVEWVFSGTSVQKSSLSQIKVRFQKDKKKWPLLLIHLEITPQEDVSYEKISQELTKKLKKPSDEILFDGRIRRVWQFSKDKGLILEGTQGDKEGIITMDIAVFQGESD